MTRPKQDPPASSEAFDPCSTMPAEGAGWGTLLQTVPPHLPNWVTIPPDANIRKMSRCRSSLIIQNGWHLETRINQGVDPAGLDPDVTLDSLRRLVAQGGPGPCAARLRPRSAAAGRTDPTIWTSTPSNWLEEFLADFAEPSSSSPTIGSSFTSWRPGSSILDRGAITSLARYRSGTCKGGVAAVE